MGPAKGELRKPGPVRELWAEAAVRERFRVGELLSDWMKSNASADRETVRAAKRAALDLQDAAKPALGADGRPAHRLGTPERLEVLSTIGAEAAQQALERTPPEERTQAEAIFAELLAGKGAAPDVQDRDRMVALSQVGPLANAAGAPIAIDTTALRQHVESLDFLNLLGGPDLHRFVGRTEQLAELRRIWDARRSGRVWIEAPGGMGKSMLISRFVADLLESHHSRPSAVFHIDFDRRDMQSVRPAGLLAEMARQVARWVGPESREAARRLAAGVQGTDGDDDFGQSRSVEAAGGLLVHRLSGLVELLEADADQDVRVVIIADSAEQVFGFNDLAAESPDTVARELFQALDGRRPGRSSQVVLIYGARCFPEEFHARAMVKISLDVLTPMEALVYLRAEAARANAQVSDEVLGEVITAVGRAPLSLRLAARLLASEDNRTDPATWVAAVRDDPERIQAILYDRVLNRLRDPNLRKLARPGLLLRRLNPQLVEKVLAEPCELDLSQVSPERLIALSAGEEQLFFRDVSDPDGQAVWHRPDVRALMLRDLDATISPETFKAVNEAAVDYYAARDDDISRAEELYHRLRLNQPQTVLAPRWTEAAGERLKRALNEFPEAARDFLRGRLGAASLAEVEGRLESLSVTSAPPPAQPIAELRGVIRRELQRGAAPLDVLVRYNLDTLDGVLGDVYAEALVASGQYGKLLADARDLLSRPGLAPPAVRAAIFGTTAGVLEGQGKLREALGYWDAARAFRDSTDDTAELSYLGASVGSLRTRRKLGLLEGRGMEVDRLTELLRRVFSGLVSRHALLREVLAELGDLLSSGADVHVYNRMLILLCDQQEAFPSAVADPSRLPMLSQRLGFGAAESVRALSDMAAKASFGGESAPRLVTLLREEVDWTLARALARPIVHAPEAYP